MCESFRTSVDIPTDICLNFTRPVQRSGGTRSHKDGWGITFYRGRSCRIFKDSQPNFDPPTAKLIQDYLIESCSTLVHIRQVNQGEVALENAHPFVRELWGRNWTYTYNEQLTGYKSLEIGNFRLIDETDDEKASYWLLRRLTQRYPHTSGSMAAVFKYIVSLTDRLRQKGVFSMLLSDGRYVMAYCSTNLHWIARHMPFGVATLLNQGAEIDSGS